MEPRDFDRLDGVLIDNIRQAHNALELLDAMARGDSLVGKKQDVMRISDIAIRIGAYRPGVTVSFKVR